MLRTSIIILSAVVLAFAAPHPASAAAEKTRDELAEEVEQLRARVAELEARLEGTAEAVNLARTSLARVGASSVNGDRALANPHYGVLNAFDGGENWIDGINYTYWLSAAEQNPWIEVRFDETVTLTEIHVEGGPPFVVRLSMARGGEQDRPEIVKDAVQFEEPVPGVRGVRLTFQEKKSVRVNEVRVMGYAPPDVVCREGRPRVMVTKRSAELAADEAFAAWERSMWDGVRTRVEEATAAFVITYYRRDLPLLEVRVDKRSGQMRAQPLAQLVPRERRGGEGGDEGEGEGGGPL